MGGSHRLLSLGRRCFSLVSMAHRVVPEQYPCVHIDPSRTAPTLEKMVVTHANNFWTIVADRVWVWKSNKGTWWMTEFYPVVDRVWLAASLPTALKATAIRKFPGITSASALVLATRIGEAAIAEKLPDQYILVNARMWSGYDANAVRGNPDCYYG